MTRDDTNTAGSRPGPDPGELRKRIEDGERAREELSAMFSRQAKLEGTPFTVSVSLCLDRESPEPWAKVGVYYSARFCGGTTAEASVPVGALLLAAELAQELVRARQDLESGGR